MKYFVKILLIIVMFTFILHVSATCNDSELVDSSHNVKVNFIEDEEIGDTNENAEEELDYAYVLAFDGANGDLKITVYDPIEKKTIDAEYSSKYKKYIVGSIIHYSPKTYEINIYSSSKTCSGELLRKINYTVPAFNEYSLSTFCKQNPNVEECKMNYDASKMTSEDFNKIKEKVNNDNILSSDNIFDNVKKYWFVVLIPILLISILYGIKIYSYKKKESKI